MLLPHHLAKLRGRYLRARTIDTSCGRFYGRGLDAPRGVRRDNRWPHRTDADRARPSHATLSYEQAGVDYDLIDPLKVAAQRAAAATATHLAAHGFSEVAASRGESAYVVDVGPFYLASIVECLGSKALVADEMARAHRHELLRRHRAGHDRDGGQRPDHRRRHAAGGAGLLGRRRLATGSAMPQRAQALVAGWKRACEACGVAWGGGETPALAGIVEAGRIDLAASCTGLINPKDAPVASATRLGRGRRDRAARLQRHPCQRPEPGAQARRAPAAGLPDADVAPALTLRRRAARADRCCIRR